MTQTKTRDSATDNFEQAADRLRDLNERIIESSRKAGQSYVDAYEKTLAHAQADFTRNWAEAYTTAARNVLK